MTAPTDARRLVATARRFYRACRMVGMSRAEAKAQVRAAVAEGRRFGVAS